MQTFFCYDPLFPFSFSCENVFDVETICILLEENFIRYTETSKQGPPRLRRTHCFDVILALVNQVAGIPCHSKGNLVGSLVPYFLLL